MKFLLFFFSFVLFNPSNDTPPVLDSDTDESLRIRICWKGPKGNKTCITVSQVSGIRDVDRDIMGSAYMAADNSGILLDLSNTSLKSFTLDENAKIGTCGSSLNLKMGTKVDVVNGFAMLK